MRAHCQKNPKGYSEWEPKLLNGKPKDWGPKDDKPGQWTVEERGRALEALAEIPDFLKNQDFDNIYRMHKLGNLDNPAATQGTNIALYDAASNSNYNLTKVLAHEMAHRYYMGLSQREQKSFRDAAGWIQDASNKSGFRAGRMECRNDKMD